VDAQHAGSLGYVALAFHEHADEETYEHASANFALQHEIQGRGFTALYSPRDAGRDGRIRYRL
jgi:hypothetical protein